MVKHVKLELPEVIYVGSCSFFHRCREGTFSFHFTQMFLISVYTVEFISVTQSFKAMKLIGLEKASKYVFMFSMTQMGRRVLNLLVLCTWTSC